MRFSTPTPRTRAAGRSVRWRIWLLFGVLAAVLMMIRQLQEPATVDALGRLFEPNALSEIRSADAETAGPNGAAPAIQPGKPLLPRNLPEEQLVRPELLAQVADHTFLRRGETAAWQAVLTAAARHSLSQLAARSLGEVPYAALIGQPQIYRGKVVTIDGTVLREERLAADAGASTAAYHRLVIAPAGGGTRPVVCYALDLPAQFPRGDPLREPIRTHGIFFKSWSYRSTTGALELAPLVVAPTILWTPRPVASADVQTVPWGKLLLGATACLAVAGIVAWRVHRATRRWQKAASGPDDLADPSFWRRLRDIENLPS